MDPEQSAMDLDSTSNSTDWIWMTIFQIYWFAETDGFQTVTRRTNRHTDSDRDRVWQLALAAELSSDKDKDAPAAYPVPSKGLRKPCQSAVKSGVATKNLFEGLEVEDDGASDHKDKDFGGSKEGSDSSETSSAASDSDIEEITNAEVHLSVLSATAQLTYISHP